MIPATQDVARALRKLKRRRVRRTILLLALAAAVIAVLLLATCFRPLRYTGRAMAPSLKDGQLIFVNMLNRTADREQVVLLSREAPEGGPMVRRIIGLAGDEISITADGTLLLNGEVLRQIPAGNRDMPDSLLIPEGYLFALGDNTAEALDSRVASVGLIAVHEVLGTVW